MITSLDFDNLLFRRPKLTDKKTPIDKIIGIDSEAYKDGSPFMFCTSFGDIIKPINLFESLFSPKYHYANFVVYNLKYDSGAILYFIPKDALYSLWEKGKAIYWKPIDSTKNPIFTDNILDFKNPIDYEHYIISYIPHKCLRIQKGLIKVTFWDISPFYHMSLDRASKIYLNKGKIEVPTKSFTCSYVKKNWHFIAEYCINDAILTKELAEYLINKLDTFNIKVSTLYSQASISFKYFCTHAKVVTSYHFWKYQRRLIEDAVDAYEGGKFEITARGSFTGYEYDIISAYPYEIANLIDISKAKIVYSKQYISEATYGFLRVFIDNSLGLYLPCGIKRNNLRIYPKGQYFLTITKEEYDYIVSLKIPIEILSASWIIVKRKIYPYRDCIAKLFEIKDNSKNVDKMIYHTSKILMNGFYGKSVQVIKQPDGSYIAGPGWNPIYGSVITANTRIKVARIQNLYNEKCIAVHTDSVMLTVPLQSDFVKNELGSFNFECKGDGILIACGMYEIGNVTAFRGFNPPENMTWREILTKYKKRKVIPSKFLHVESWVEAMAKNHNSDRINVFSKDRKDIDLNCDTKRIWPKSVTSNDLLTKLQKSIPKIHNEINPPIFWKKYLA